MILRDKMNCELCGRFMEKTDVGFICIGEFKTNGHVPYIKEKEG